MVRLAAPVAINSEDGASEAQVGETAEFQEGRIHADYQEALRLQHAGNKTEAQVNFEYAQAHQHSCAHTRDCFSGVRAAETFCVLTESVQAAPGRASFASIHHWHSK